MFKIGDHVRVTEKYPAYDLIRYHVGRVHSIKMSHLSSDANGVIMAIRIDFDDGPGGDDGLVFYDYELEKIK